MTSQALSGVIALRLVSREGSPSLLEVRHTHTNTHTHTLTGHSNLPPSTAKRPVIASLKSTGTFSSHILTCSTTPFHLSMSPLTPFTLTVALISTSMMPLFLVNLFSRHHRVPLHQVRQHTSDKRSLRSSRPPRIFFLTIHQKCLFEV